MKTDQVSNIKKAYQAHKDPTGKNNTRVHQLDPGVFVQNKLQKAGYEAKTRSGTRTPTLRRRTRRTSSSKGSKRGREGRKREGVRHGTFTHRYSPRVFTVLGQMNTLC